MNELEELKKELEEVLEKVNKKIKESEKEYWTVEHDGEIKCDRDFGYDVDIFNKEIGNYFKTKKEAEEYLEDLKVKTEIKNIAKELNADKKIDWDDADQSKYSLMYDYDDSEVTRNHDRVLKSEGTIYCLDSNFMNVCIERIGEERLENYLKRR